MADTDGQTSEPPVISVGIRQSNGRKTLAVVFSAALVAIVIAKIGSRSFSGTGIMTGDGADVTATLHYTVS